MRNAECGRCCNKGYKEWRKIVQNGQTEPQRGKPEAVRRQNKADFASVLQNCKTYAQCIVFPFPKKHSLLFGVPESRKTLRGEE